MTGNDFDSHSKHTQKIPPTLNKSRSLAFIEVHRLQRSPRSFRLVVDPPFEMMSLSLVAAAALLLCCAFVVVVRAVAPPNPNYVRHDEFPYESLSSYRRRRNITFHYEPRYISPQHCRFLTEEECARDDEAAYNRIEESRRQRAAPGRRLQGGPGFATEGNNIKVLTLLCRFADHEDRDLPDRSYYDQLLNGGAVNPVGGLSEWLFANSGGRYNGALAA